MISMEKLFYLSFSPGQWPVLYLLSTTPVTPILFLLHLLMTICMHYQQIPEWNDLFPELHQHLLKNLAIKKITARSLQKRKRSWKIIQSNQRNYPNRQQKILNHLLWTYFLLHLGYSVMWIQLWCYWIVFSILIDDDLINTVVTEMNRYANFIMSNKMLTHDAWLQQWKDTIPSES